MWDLGKNNILGVLVDAVDSDAAVHKVMTAARERRGFAALPLGVPELVVAMGDPAARARLNRLDLAAPGGRPLTRSLNRLYRATLTRAVTGPRLALLLCRAAAEEGLPLFLYGADAATLARLADELGRRFPGLTVAGGAPVSPAWGEPDERAAIVQRIRSSGARLVLVGLAPADEARFVSDFRDALGMPVVATGGSLMALAGGRRARSLAPVARLRFATGVLLQWLRLWRPDPHEHLPAAAERTAPGGALPAGQPND